jgi:hypothetical protein
MRACPCLLPLLTATRDEALAYDDPHDDFSTITPNTYSPFAFTMPYFILCYFLSCSPCCMSASSLYRTAGILPCFAGGCVADWAPVRPQ